MPDHFQNSKQWLKKLWKNVIVGDELSALFRCCMKAIRRYLESQKLHLFEILYPHFMPTTVNIKLDVASRVVSHSNFSLFVYGHTAVCESSALKCIIIIIIIMLLCYYCEQMNDEVIMENY